MKEGLWEETLDRIRETIPENEFSSWFNRLVFGKEEDGKITLYVPSAFVRDRFESSYRTTIEDIFNEIGDGNYSISFEIKKNAQNQQISKKTEEKPKTETSNSNPDQKVQKPSKPSADDMMFNPAYTFESFIPGDNSSFAYSACMAIAKNPGSAYNPCLLYGGVGLGKTHLIQSIGNYIRKNTKLKVVYVTAENFTNEYIQSLNDKNPQQFKNKYRKVSVLLIDDIHFLQRKEGSLVLCHCSCKTV